MVERCFSLLCNCSSQNYESIITKLKSTHHSGNQQLVELILSLSLSPKADLIKQKTVAAVITSISFGQSDGGLVRLCDAVEELFDHIHLVHQSQCDMHRCTHVCILILSFDRNMYVSIYSSKRN